jgi:hypothetical protein
MKTGLTVDTAESYLNRIRAHSDPDFTQLFIDFVSSKHALLSKKDFPFHMLGKTMLLQVMKHILKPIPTIVRLHRSTEKDIGIGDPSENDSYPIFKERRFHYFTLQFKGQQYPVHKYILVSESLSFSDCYPIQQWTLQGFTWLNQSTPSHGKHLKPFFSSFTPIQSPQKTETTTAVCSCFIYRFSLRSKN